MTDEELRDMIRGAIAKHLGNAPQAEVRGRDPGVNLIATPRTYASFGLLPLARGADGDGACLIEPTVRCNHCGYCLSYGH
jgi:hypothetical protein